MTTELPDEWKQRLRDRRNSDLSAMLQMHGLHLSDLEDYIKDVVNQLMQQGKFKT